MTMLVGIVILVILLSGLRIAQEYQRGVVFRLGRYLTVRGPGLYWITVLMIPSDFVTLAKSFSDYLREHALRNRDAAR